MESKLQIVNLIGHDLLILSPLSFYKNWNCLALSCAGFLMLVHVFQVFVHLVKFTTYSCAAKYFNNELNYYKIIYLIF